MTFETYVPPANMRGTSPYAADVFGVTSKAEIAFGEHLAKILGFNGSKKTPSFQVCVVFNRQERVVGFRRPGTEGFQSADTITASRQKGSKTFHVRASKLLVDELGLELPASRKRRLFELAVRGRLDPGVPSGSRGVSSPQIRMRPGHLDPCCYETLVGAMADPEARERTEIGCDGCTAIMILASDGAWERKPEEPKK